MKVTPRQAQLIADALALNPEIDRLSVQLTRLRGSQRALINRLPRKLWTFVQTFGVDALDTSGDWFAGDCLSKVKPASPPPPEEAAADATPKGSTPAPSKGAKPDFKPGTRNTNGDLMITRSQLAELEKAAAEKPSPGDTALDDRLDKLLD